MSILVVEYIDTFILFNANTAFWWGGILRFDAPQGRHAAPIAGVRPPHGKF